jgi:hypothetical protein
MHGTAERNLIGTDEWPEVMFWEFDEIQALKALNADMDRSI